MQWRLRSCVFLSIALVVFVLVFLKNKYGQQNIAVCVERTERELMSETWARNRSEEKEESNQDDCDHVIIGLKQELMKVRIELYKLKKSCRESGVSSLVQTKKLTRTDKKELNDKKDSKRSRETQGITKENQATGSHRKGRIPAVLQTNNNCKVPRKQKHIFLSFTSVALYGANIETPPDACFTSANLGQTGEYRHLNEALNTAMEILQKSLKLPQSDNITLIRGIYYENTNRGVEYEFQCSLGDNTAIYNVRLMRPYSALTLIQKPARVLRWDELINIIVPLTGRTQRFEQFLQHFIEVCILPDENVFLTIVYHGKENLTEAKSLLRQMEKQYGFKHFYFVQSTREFSRGHALHDGVLRWGKRKNVLMFFCDVDIKFESGFLDRCRSYTEPARKVYYPIVFSLYNPKYVRKMTSQLMEITKATGFWRYYGYGMTCQYRDDYFSVGSFNLEVKGWGSEDVMLYKKYVKLRHIRVIRAPDKGLFHYYHPKKCDTSLPWKQRRNCMTTKLDNEASKAQFGKRIFELEETNES